MKMTDKLRFDSEYTIEMCYYYYDISSTSDHILEISTYINNGGVLIPMTSIDLNNANPARHVVEFTPFKVNMTNAFIINVGDP